MKKINIQHANGEVAVIGSCTFSIKELKEGVYNVWTSLGSDEKLFAINIVHDSLDEESVNDSTGSEPFEGYFQHNQKKVINLDEEFTFPSGKTVVPFILSDGDQNIGMSLVAHDPLPRGRKKYDFAKEIREFEQK
jgi:hypothetical protein